MFDFQEIPYSKYWLENLLYFSEWCFYEKKGIRRENVEGSNQVPDNAEMFQQKYPAIEDAYKEFHKWMNSPR